MRSEKGHINQSAQSGFTLIELLISLTLMSMMMVLMTGAIRLVSSSWDRSTQRMSKLEAYNRVAGLFRRDVESLRRIVVKSDNANEFVFSGTRKQMSFVVVEPEYPTSPGFYLIRYGFDKSKKGLSRSRRKYNSSDGVLSSVEEGGGEVALLEKGLSHSFEYGVIKDEVIVWSQEWSELNQLPALIKLVVKADKEKMIPIIAKVRIDSEQECLGTNAFLCTAKTAGVLRGTGQAGKVGRR